jgi:hydrogenase maturation protein HypF
MGRLFDGVYALLTGRETVSYEGQGAILLEAMAEPGGITLPVEFYEEDGVLRFDWRPTLTALCDSDARPEHLAAAFMDALVDMGLRQCLSARERTGLNRVVLSGGVFQNMYLLPRLMDGLAAHGFEAYCHSRVSANDEGIALGQLVIADAMLKR